MAAVNTTTMASRARYLCVCLCVPFVCGGVHMPGNTHFLADFIPNPSYEPPTIATAGEFAPKQKISCRTAHQRQHVGTSTQLTAL